MNFQKAVDHVIENEGGDKYTDHPLDPGGATKFGITLKTLSGYRGKTCTKDDVKNLTRTEAIAIYKKLYWDAIKGDQIKSPKVATVIFDQAVNRGPASVIKQAQKVAGVTQDGLIGMATISAINAMPEANFVSVFLAESKSFYENLVNSKPSQGVFLKGWLNRVTKLGDFVEIKPVVASVGVALVAFVFFLILLTSRKGKTA